MDPSRICLVCSGTEFFRDCGYYFCKECETQCEDIRETFNVAEAVSEYIETDAPTTSSFKKHSVKQDSRISNWEFYNQYLYNIVNEFISLGVNDNFKKTIQSLWFKYLDKIEVIDVNDATALPKLQTLNSLDQEVIYGRIIKKKPRKRKSNTNIRVLDESKLGKRKSIRTLAHSQYTQEEKSKSKMSTNNQSLNNLTIDNSDETTKSILEFSKAAKEAHSKLLGEEHFQQHVEDVESELFCHSKIKRVQLPHNFYRSFHMISRAKIYSLIYLALLITKDDIHYADIVRYINEGHLTFRYYKHFFDGVDVEPFNEKCALFCHMSMSNYIYDLIRFLGVSEFVPMQDIVALCSRYCIELNLPSGFTDCVIRLLGRSKPNLNFGKNGRNRLSFPNYEGRAISFIIFTLKLLFGLDGVTEFKFSKLAKLITEHSEPRNNIKHFDFENWLHHILYRKLVITHHHIPSFHQSNNSTCPSEDASTYINFLKTQHKVLYIGQENKNENFKLHNFVKNIKERINKRDRNINFPPSLTPFRDYTKVILDSKVADEEEYLTDVLKQDFSKCSIDFLLNTENYIKANIKHRGAIKRFKTFKCFNSERRDYRNILPAYMTTLVNDDCKVEETLAAEEVKRVLQEHKEKYWDIFSDEKEETSSESKIESSEYKIHYKPEDTFWVYAYDLNNVRNDEFEKYYINLPLTFRIIVEECARILNTTAKHLLDDYLHLEIYLAFVFDPISQDKMKGKFQGDDAVLKSLINRSKAYW